MSLLCVGQYVDGQDATPFCYENGVIFLGFDLNDEPVINDAFANIPLGSPVAIKSFTPNDGLTIKAVAIVCDNRVFTILFNGKPRQARKVKFLWKGNEHFGRLNDKLDSVRNGTLYQEMNNSLIEKIINLIE